MPETIDINDALAILAAKAIKEKKKKKEAELWECTKCGQTFSSEAEAKKHVEEEIEKEIAEEKRKALLWKVERGTET